MDPETTIEGTTIGLEVMIEEATTVVVDSNGTIEAAALSATIARTTVAIGTAPSATTIISHSVKNATDAANHEVAEEGNPTIEASNVEMIEEATTDLEETTDRTTAWTAIGTVLSATTTISRGEPSATNVEHQNKAVKAALAATTAEVAMTAEAMTAEVATTDEVAKCSTTTIGTVRNATTQISHSDKNATDVACHEVEGNHAHHAVMTAEVATDLEATTAEVATDLEATTDEVATDLEATTEEAATDLEATTDEVATDLEATTEEAATDLEATTDEVATDLEATTEGMATVDLPEESQEKSENQENSVKQQVRVLGMPTTVHLATSWDETEKTEHRREGRVSHGR
jgi:hypothetical protein